MAGYKVRGCGALDAEERIGFPLSALWMQAYLANDESTLLRLSIVARCISELSPQLLPIVLAAGWSRTYGRA